MQHLLIILKDYLRQLWIWSFECFRSLMMMMISKKQRRDLSWYPLNGFWIILFMSFPAEIILSFYKLLWGYFWRLGTSLLASFTVYWVQMNAIFFADCMFTIFLLWQIHGETIRQQSCLQEKARKLLDIQCMVWQRVDKLFQSSRCVIAFLSNSQI